MVLSFSLVMAPPVSAGTTDVYPGPGTPIQDAVDAAAPGDTIIVHPGIYPEEVEITKALTLQGIGWPTIEAPLGLNSNAIWIGASDVTVTGFELKAPDDIVDINPYHLPSPARINNVVIENNHVTPTDVVSDPNAPGIFACRVDNLIVRDNIIHNTGGIGIFLGMGPVQNSVDDSVIEGNKVVDSGYTGILVCNGSRNMVRSNDVRSAGTPAHLDDGIRLGWGAINNTVEANRVSGSSHDGIRAVKLASGNTIQNNKSVGNRRYDINDDGTLGQNTWSGNKFKTQGGSATG